MYVVTLLSLQFHTASNDKAIKHTSSSTHKYSQLKDVYSNLHYQSTNSYNQIMDALLSAAITANVSSHQINQMTVYVYMGHISNNS